MTKDGLNRRSFNRLAAGAALGVMALGAGRVARAAEEFAARQ